MGLAAVRGGVAGRLPTGAVLIAALVVLLVALPGVAQAAECTDTWVGPSGGDWATSGNWSAESPPSASDVACVGSGDKAKVKGGKAQAEILQGEGTVVIEAGSLTLSSATEPSNIGTLRLEGGSRNGAATLFVTSSLEGAGGALEGVGETVVGEEANAVVSDLESEAHAGLRVIDKHTFLNRGTTDVNGPAAALEIAEGATVENRNQLVLVGAKAVVREQSAHLVNAGTLEGEGLESRLRAIEGSIENEGVLKLLEAGSQIEGSEGVRLENAGELVLDGEEVVLENVGTGAQPVLDNTGSFVKGSGGQLSFVDFEIHNQGRIEARGGELAFLAGASSEPGENHWGGEFGEGKLLFAVGSYALGETAEMSGEVSILSEADVSAGHLEAPGSWIKVEEGTLELTDSEATSHFGRLDLIGSSLTLPSGATGIAGFLGLAEGNLAIPEGAKWQSGIEEVAGEIDVLPGGHLVSSFVEKVGGDIRVQSGATASFGGLEQLEGSFVVESGAELAPINTLGIVDGSVAFGEGVEASINDLEQEGGTFVVEKTAGFRPRVWLHEGGVATVAAESSVHAEVVESHGGEMNIGAGSTVEGLSWLGVFAGELAVGTGTQIHGATSGTFGGAFTLEGVSQLELSSALLVYGGELGGSGSTASSFLSFNGGTFGGNGVSTVSTASEVNAGEGEAKLDRRALQTEGHFYLESGRLEMGHGAALRSSAEFEANSEAPGGGQVEAFSGGSPGIVSTGPFEKTKGTGTTTIDVPFENFGTVGAREGQLQFNDPLSRSATEETQCPCEEGDPVNSATGNFSEAQTDVRIPALGVDLALTRTYSAAVASGAGSAGPFGYGWSGTFTDHLLSEEGGNRIVYVSGTGHTTPFTRNGEGAFAAPSWSQDKLSGSAEAGYTLLLADRTEYAFSGSGRLESIVDRNGNETTLAYEEGHLTTISDPSGQHLTLAYNGAGEVESVEDPMGHLTSYTYEGGELKTVTMPGEAEPRWGFEYDPSHRLTKMTDGRGGETVNEYDGSGRVISQTDPAGRTTAFDYAPFHTTVTNEATGSISDEWFTSNNEPFKITRGFETLVATTQTFAYDEAGYMEKQTDGNGHTTTYGYDGEGNLTSEVDPLGHETSWEYNATHDLIATTSPRGETTTIARDAQGNVESVSRPGPEEMTRMTSLTHDPEGLLESITDPLERTWMYGYDASGNLVRETDPAGDERTIGYDGDNRVNSITSPRGNLEGAEPAEFTTMVERDAQGRPLEVTDPLGAVTEFEYDGNGNLASLTDANGHTTTYAYNPDDERTEVEKPNRATLQTDYDGAGDVISQTDGNGKTTEYVRNVLGQPVEVIDPLGRKTLKAFDAAGNMIGVDDAAERETTYAYDKANRLTSASYSEEATPDASFEYDEDGNLIEMSDGSGESSWHYDQLGQLTRSQTGHGEVVEYGYDPAGELAELVYPNGKTVTRSYDDAGRLESVADWLGGVTTFEYDADSNLAVIDFPAESGNVDEYSYDHASRMGAATFKKGTETLASLSYVRDPLGQVEAETRSGLPGPAAVAYGYDENNRLTKAGGEEFEYDPADHLTKGNGSSNAYDDASQLESGTGVAYGYDALGERTKVTPASGPATTYGYDQAGDLTSISRPEEGEVSALAEEMSYDGTGLLASRSNGLAPQHLTWDESSALPLLLDDGASSYLYGPGDLPLEQISSTEAPTYLHHDQLGSTRLLSDASGAPSATFSYEPYGELEGKTGTGTSPLGFAGQYTDAESGLQYLRARFYDPVTGQFMARDPLESVTRYPYSYGFQNPLNRSDPSGLFGELVEGGCIAGEIADPLGGCAPGVLAGGFGEVGRYAGGVGGAASGWLFAEVVDGDDSDSGESSAEEVPPPKTCEEGAERKLAEEIGTELGDPREVRIKDLQFLDKLGHASGSSPNGPSGGSRLVRVAALLARLLHLYHH
jgi:RHS repeat-associated protein